MDSIAIDQIVYVLSYGAISLLIPIVAITILIALQRRSEIRGFKFFIIGFLSQILSIIIGVILSILRWLSFTTPSRNEVWAISSAIERGFSIFLSSLSYIFLILGFLLLLGYKARVNGLAIVSAVLSGASLFIPWFAIDTSFIAPTYVFPFDIPTYSEVQWLLPIIVALLTIAAYCFVIGSIFSGLIGRILILAGGVLAFASPFTYLLLIDETTPWIGLAIPFISMIIACFAFQHHPKELERIVLETIA